MTHNKKKPEILWRGEFPPSVITSILDNAGEGIWYIDRHNRIRAVNSKGAEIVGCSKDEMIGRSPVDYLTHADSREGDKAVDKSGVHSLHKILRRDGSAAHVISRTVPLPLEDGMYGGALIYLLNVTEVNRWDHLGKDKEVLLQEARMERDMLYQIIDHYPDEVGFFDQEFRCIYANSTLAASIGGRRGDIGGKSIQEMPFAQSDPSGIVTVLDSVFRTGEPVCQEGVYMTEHGELTRYLFVGPVTTPEQDVVAVFVISRTQLLYESE